MSKGDHDKLVRRLAIMLSMLNEGRKLVVSDLAIEFNVSKRTIERDLKERLNLLPLEYANGCYTLDPAFLGQCNLEDLTEFAQFAGISGMLPNLSRDALREFFDWRIRETMLIKGHHYEDLSGKSQLFDRLKQAITEHNVIAFAYRRDEVKRYSDIHPYRLINNKGIWYLAATDCGKLKTYAFTKIAQLEVMSDQHFSVDTALSQQIVEEDGIWFAQEKIEVVLKVSRDVAGYFKRRHLLANQVIEKELEDGGLLVSAKVGHANQILPIVRYWIPHVQIISPEGMQTKFEAELRSYLQSTFREIAHAY